MDRCASLLMALKDKADGFIVLSPPNRRYFSGFTGSNAMLFAAPDTRLLITDFRYMEQAKRQCPQFETQIAKRGEEYAALAGAVRESKATCVGFEAQSLSFSQHARIIEALPAGVELVPADDEIARLRAVKSPSELAGIKEAARVADAVFAELLEFLRPGVTEIEAAAFIEYRLKLNGAEGASFPPIVAAGENAALPHAESSKKPMRAGELVVLDFGARVGGYCSDMTRTVALGYATDEQRALYALVLKAQERALAAIKPGQTGREADAFARDIIAAAGYGEQFGHGLGHGVGVEIHEAPTLSASSEDTLTPGMTVTVEPGVYIPGFTGVRIEDLCAVTEAGAQNFTSSIKDFMIL